MLELVRFKEFSSSELAPGLFAAAAASRVELQARFSPGTVRRLGTDALVAQATVERTIRQDSASDVRRSGAATFAVVERSEAEGDALVVGAATVVSGLKLYVHHVPLPPRITDRIPSQRVRTEALYGHANVSGWTTLEHYDELEAVYHGLLQEVPEPYSAWTVEPARANPLVHAAIVAAGMTLLDSKPERYDVGEDRGVLPPHSLAYVTL